MCERTEPISELYCPQGEKNSGTIKINNMVGKMCTYKIPEGQSLLLVARTKGRPHPPRNLNEIPWVVQASFNRKYLGLR